MGVGCYRGKDAPTPYRPTPGPSLPGRGAEGDRHGQNLTGRVTLVTGASTGIGEATALALAAAGASVALSARRTDRLAALVARIAATGGTAHALPGDVSVESEATHAVDDTVARFGRIDILVNSAGATQTEVAGGIADPALRAAMTEHVSKPGAMQPGDIAEAIIFVVSLPARANVSQILIRPTGDVAAM